MRNLLPKAIENSPWTALALLAGVSCAPAINLTFEEWKDTADSVKSTVWNGELVIDAWKCSLSTVALGIYGYLTRSGAKEKEAEDLKNE